MKNTSVIAAIATILLLPTWAEAQTALQKSLKNLNNVMNAWDKPDEGQTSLTVPPPDSGATADAAGSDNGATGNATCSDNGADNPQNGNGGNMTNGSQQETPHEPPQNSGAAGSAGGQSEGDRLYNQMVSAKQDLANAEATMRYLFAPQRVRAFVKAQPQAGDNGSAIVLDAATGDLAVRVRSWVDMAAYKQWVDDVIGRLGPMATARHEGLMSKYNQERYGKGETIYISSSLTEYNSATYNDTFEILCNLRAFQVTGLSFDKDKAELLKKTLPRYNAVFQVSLLDKNGEAIKIEKVGRRILSCRSYLKVGPVLADYDGRDELLFRVPFGKMTEKDVRDIDKVKVDVMLTGETR